MKRIITIVLLSVSILSVDAQVDKLAGPKVGITMVSAGSLASLLRKDVPFFPEDGEPSIRDEWAGSTGKYGAVMSQYGWQWESRFADGGEVTGIVEWIALVGGMEKGMFLPSASSMVGVRTASGVEFAVGPNFSLGGIAMVIAAGYNFKFGKLNLPVNIAYVPSMNKKYEEDAEYDYGEVQVQVDPDGIPNNGDEYMDWENTETLISPAYSVTHPTGARISVMVGFNLSK
jgi:hypothetical protein